jgi:hypothetical protein
MRGFTKTEQNKEGENRNTAGRGLPIFIMYQNGRKQVECSHLRSNQKEGGGGGGGDAQNRAYYHNVSAL